VLHEFHNIFVCPLKLSSLSLVLLLAANPGDATLPLLMLNVESGSGATGRVGSGKELLKFTRRDGQERFVLPEMLYYRCRNLPIVTVQGSQKTNISSHNCR